MKCKTQFVIINENGCDVSSLGVTKAILSKFHSKIIYIKNVRNWQKNNVNALCKIKG